MRLKFNVLILFLFILQGCGSSSLKDITGTDSTGVYGTRQAASEKYQSVGMIAYHGWLLCTASILKHGVLVTAKHCFSNKEPSKDSYQYYSIHFPKTGTVDNDNTYVISGSDIMSIILDGDNNDLAYIIYDKSKTENYIAIDAPKIETNDPKEGSPLHLVGFPACSDGVYRRLLSSSCKVTGKTGYLPPKPMDPGYDGKLYDTNCIAWKGNSGGPIYYINENTEMPISIVGVVTHTFNVTEDGAIDEDLQKTDKYGTFVYSVNMSPFSQAERLDEILSM